MSKKNADKTSLSILKEVVLGVKERSGKREVALNLMGTFSALSIRRLSVESVILKMHWASIRLEARLYLL